MPRRRARSFICCQAPNEPLPTGKSSAQSFNLPNLTINPEAPIQPAAPSTSGLNQAEAPSPPKGPFSFLRDGRQSLRDGKSPFLGRDGKSSLFPPQRATGGLFGAPEPAPEPAPAPAPAPLEPASKPPTPAARTHRFPSWESWKDWKKISLDLCVRLVDRPRETRVRLKQTVALLPVVKLKPVIDLGFRGEAKPPVAMHLDVKLLDCLKYRVRADGSAAVQVRARAPLSDPRFVMDVVYERELASALETVKISFRALDVAFLKAPGFGAGVKFPIRFDGGIKSTVRVKKFLEIGEAASQSSTGRRRALVGKGQRATSRYANRETQRASGQRGASKFGISGPSGVDIKLRCLEYR